MPKVLFKSFMVILGLALSAVLAFWIFKAPVLSYYLSKQLKVSVSVHNLEFSKNQVVIKGFQINNPLKYQERTAFKAEKIVVDYQVGQLPKKIDSIQVMDSHMNISCENPLCTDNNWTDIARRVAKKEVKANQEPVVIEKLYFDELIVDAEDMHLFPGKEDRLELTNLEFRNISSDQGFPIQQLIVAIFRSAGLTDLLKDVFKNSSIFNDVMKSFQDDKYN